MKKTVLALLVILLAAFAMLSLSSCLYSNGLEYELSEDGTYYTVVGMGSCKDTKIYIPEKYEGIPVTAIGEGAFENCTDITEITIGYTITSVGAYAFRGCTSLEEINLDAALIDDMSYSVLGDEHGAVFYGAGSSKTGITLNIGKRVTRIPSCFFFNSNVKTVIFEEDSELTSIGSNAFRNCALLESIDIPKRVTDIEMQAFIYCTSLTSIDLPTDLTSIGDSAFCNCTSLESIIIPSKVKLIEFWAFGGCSSLKEVAFDEDDGWVVAKRASSVSKGESIDVSQKEDNAYLLTKEYNNYIWRREK